ncbi:MAG: efflux RND transporter periplasmic adaptor subunit [Desulfovibrionaceae bacterium]|nr:efflux RND transporter periplasmic adaptor subunit [Desulfovibrionaceae bacterium]
MPKKRCCLVFLLVVGLILAQLEISWAEEAPKALVKTMTVEAKDLVPVVDFVGKTTGSLSVQIRAQVGGILRKRNFREGDYVKKGDVLFEIAPETYKASYDRARAKREQAEAVYENAKREWSRAQNLYSKNAISQKDRDRTQAQINSAKADLDATLASEKDAKIQLEYAYVTAPVSGYTSKEYQTEGNLISTSGDSSLLTELTQMDPIYVEFSMSNTDLLKLRQLVDRGFATWGDKPEAKILFADGSLYEHVGEINFFDHKVDPVTSVVKARASFPNPEGLVLPGQFVRIAISGPSLTKALAVPRSSILHTQQGPMVMVVDKDNKVSSRNVTILLNMDDDAILEKGLKPGEKIVIEGIGKIRDGQTIQEAKL